MAISVTSTSLGWLRTVVEGHERVDMIDVIRTPGAEPFDFERAVRDT